MRPADVWAQAPCTPSPSPHNTPVGWGQPALTSLQRRRCELATFIILIIPACEFLPWAQPKLGYGLCRGEKNATLLSGDLGRRAEEGVPGNLRKTTGVLGDHCGGHSESEKENSRGAIGKPWESAWEPADGGDGETGRERASSLLPSALRAVLTPRRRGAGSGISLVGWVPRQAQFLEGRPFRRGSRPTDSPTLKLRKYFLKGLSVDSKALC